MWLKQHQISATHLTPTKPVPSGEDAPRSVSCCLVRSQAWHNTGARCSPLPTIRAGLWLLSHCWEPFPEVGCAFKCAASLGAGKPSETALPVTALAQHRGYQSDWLLTGTACIVDTEFKSQRLPHAIQMHQRDAPLSYKHSELAQIRDAKALPLEGHTCRLLGQTFLPTSEKQ